MVLPLSRLSITASSRALRLINLVNLISTSLRSDGCIFDQRPSSNASRAFSTAISTSAAPQAATFAIRSPVAGFTDSNVSPEIAARNPPSMNACVGNVIPAAMALYSSVVKRSLMCVAPLRFGRRCVSAREPPVPIVVCRLCSTRAAVGAADPHIAPPFHNRA